MKGNFVKFKDFTTLNFSNFDKEDVSTSLKITDFAQSGENLLVTLAATHSGIVNRNNMFYLPDKMREGVKTWTSPFKKPLILNHDSHSDPIGRIIDAKYVDTSFFVKDKFIGKKLKDSFGSKSLVLTDNIFDSFINGKMSFGSQVDFIRSYLQDSILKDPDYAGLGYIEVTARVSDKEAIAKFLDGRYLTSSVGASTDRAVCSICKDDWTLGDMCDHRPGGVYDGADAYLIAGNFEYDELSIVNKPADRQSKVLSLSFNNSVKDHIIEKTEYSSKVFEVQVKFLKEEDMPNKKIKDSEEVVPSTPESLNDFLSRILDSKENLSLEDDEKLYGLILAEAKELKLLDDSSENKLTAEKRKALSKAVFCGPGRSFPATDKAHILASYKLLDKYSGAVSKDTVVSALARKAKVLGFSLTDEVNSVKEVIKLELNDGLSEDTLKTNLVSVFDFFKKHKPVLLKTVLSESESALLEDFAKLEDQLGVSLEENKVLKDKISELTSLNDSLKAEYAVATKEAELLQDEVVQAKAASRETKLNTLKVFKTLKEGKVLDTASFDLTISDSVLDSELTSLSNEVDLSKIVDKITDGTSRLPNGQRLDNPAEVNNNHKIVDVQEVKRRLEQINEVYMKMKFQNSILAEKYLTAQMAAMEAQGLLPKDSE